MDKPKKKPRGRPFAKGNSANPGGRPKSNLLKLLGQYATKLAPGMKVTYGELLVQRMWKEAIENGDRDFANDIWNRLEGKIPDSLQVGGPQGQPLKPGTAPADPALAAIPTEALLKLLERSKK